MFTVSTADRMATLGNFMPKRVAELDRVLHDVDLLSRVG